MSAGGTFIKVHDGMPDHPKVDGLSDRAFRVLVETWCWCSRNLTDGRVPTTVWKKRCPARVAKELQEAGLVEPVEGGVQMHDYLDHQTSKAQVEHIRQVRSAAGKKGGRPPKPPTGSRTPSKHPESNLLSNREANGEAQETQKTEDRRRTALPSGSAAASRADAAAPGQPALIEVQDPPDTGETVNQQAQRITRTYHEREPMSRFPAVMKIVKRALESGRYSEEQITTALLRMASDRRSVTVDALRVELDGPPLRAVSGGHVPWRNPSDPSVYHEEL